MIQHRLNTSGDAGDVVSANSRERVCLGKLAQATSPTSPTRVPAGQSRIARREDLFVAAAAGQRTLESASVDDIERDAGRLYRAIVARGGVCPCGAFVASWPWAARMAGMPAPVPRFVTHSDDCPALIPEEP